MELSYKWKFELSGYAWLLDWPQVSVSGVHFDPEFVVLEDHRDGAVLAGHAEQLLGGPLYDAEAKRPADLHSVHQPGKRHVLRLCTNTTGMGINHWHTHTQQPPTFYGQYTGQPALAGTSS